MSRERKRICGSIQILLVFAIASIGAGTDSPAVRCSSAVDPAVAGQRISDRCLGYRDSGTSSAGLCPSVVAAEQPSPARADNFRQLNCTERQSVTRDRAGDDRLSALRTGIATSTPFQTRKSR